MKKLITKFANWWLKRAAPSIHLDSTITYCEKTFDIHSIDVSFLKDGKTEMTIHARERDDA